MATAKKPSMVGKTVKVNADLQDLKGKPHPFAGLYVDLISKTGKAYIASGPEDQTAVLHDGDFEVADTTEGAIVPAGNVRHEDVALDQIQECPTNPRRTFNQASLEELAETIKLVGVMQEILLRPMWAGDVMTHYEIVFGHRRFRASKLAGVPTIPAMIRELTDAQSARLQAIENLQREDLDPIEEAQGYADLIKTPGLNALDIGTEIGKSRTFVYNQLKLLKLCEVGKRLVRCKVLKTELAIEVARLTTEDLQLEALKWICNHGDISLQVSETWAATPPEHYRIMSYREGRNMIEQRFRRHLKDALFGRSIMFLVADRPDCNSCEERAGNIPELKATGDRADICTNPGCFELKTQAHIAQIAEDARQLPGKVIDAAEAQELNLCSMWKNALVEDAEYVELDDDTNYRVNIEADTVRAALGKKLKPADVVRIVHPKTGHVIEAVHQDLLIKHGMMDPEKEDEEQPAETLSPAEKKAREDQRKKDLATAAREREISLLMRERVFQMTCTLSAGLPRKPGDLHAMLCIMWEVAQYGDTVIDFGAWARGHSAEISDMVAETVFGDAAAARQKKIYAWLASLPADKQGQLCLELCLLQSMEPRQNSGEPDVLMTVAPTYGVDFKQIRSHVVAELDATPAGK